MPLLDLERLANVESNLIIGTGQLDPLDVWAQTNPDQQEIGKGFNSTAYQVGDFVVKVSRRTYHQAEAYEVAQSMNQERQLLARYHDAAHLPPTTSWVANLGDGERNNIVTMQPFIAGRTLAEHIADPTSGNVEIEIFMINALTMFYKEDKIADLCNLEGGFNLMRTGNLVVTDEAKPVLVDDTFGKLQRSKLFGRAINGGIARGVTRGLRQIVAADS